MLSKMAASKSEQYKNKSEKVRYDKYEQDYRGDIKKGRKGFQFGVGILILKYKNIPHNGFFGLSIINPPCISWDNFQQNVVLKFRLEYLQK